MGRNADPGRRRHLLVVGDQAQRASQRALSEMVRQVHHDEGHQPERDDQLFALGDVEAQQAPVPQRDARHLRDQPVLHEEPAAGGEGEGQRGDGQGETPDPQGRQPDGEAGDDRSQHPEDDRDGQGDVEVGVGPGGDEGPDSHQCHLGQRDLARPVDEDVEPGRREDGDGHLDGDGVAELRETPGAEEGERQPEADAQTLFVHARRLHLGHRVFMPSSGLSPAAGAGRARSGRRGRPPASRAGSSGGSTWLRPGRWPDRPRGRRRRW